MSDLAQFWASWWVQLAVAVGTVSAVVVALFGQAFRGKFFPPRLAIDLAEATGEPTRVRLVWMEDNQPQERWEDARYYHVRVRNLRRWSPAEQAQVVLLRVEEPGAGGQLLTVWTGDVPLSWRHQETMPTLRTIGPDAYADLCSVVKGKWLQLHPLVAPNNLHVLRREASTLVVTVQARSNETDSAPLRFQVSWDGGWHDGAEEMRRHLSVRVLEPAVA